MPAPNQHPLDRRGRAARGQTAVEFGIVAPFLLVFMLAVGDIGYTLYQRLMMSTLAREGSNLIARYRTLDDAKSSLLADVSQPLAFDGSGAVVLSVIKLGTSGSNNGKAIVAQRLQFGGLTATSAIGSPPSAAYASDADHGALDLANDTRIRSVQPLPYGLTVVAGQSIYVTEIFAHRRGLIADGMFGFAMPHTLSARACF